MLEENVRRGMEMHVRRPTVNSLLHFPNIQNERRGDDLIRLLREDDDPLSLLGYGIVDDNNNGTIKF